MTSIPTHTNLTPLGDPHNFGKRVCAMNNGAAIFKPRTTAWEQLFLGHDSPLRKSIDYRARSIGISSPLIALPCLKVEQTTRLDSGHVEKLNIQTPGRDHCNSSDFRNIGSALGYLLWFGLTDLHNANTVFGTDASGKLIFGPVDVECVFDQCYLPSQAHLIPSNTMKPENAGLFKVLNFMHEQCSPELIAPLCEGYLEAISFFEEYDAEFMAFFEQESLSSVPVRIILRDTKDYYRLLDKNELGPDQRPLSKCEQAQLDRGDIPYFFRHFSSSEILFYSSENQHEPSNLDEVRTQRALASARMPQNGRFLTRAYTSELRKYGALQLARYFDFGQHSASFKSKNITVEYRNKDVLIQYKNQLSIGCKRLPNLQISSGEIKCERQ